VVADHLMRSGGIMPSVYLERGGLLRCMAQRGLWQVLDGMPPGAGVTGRTYLVGETVQIEDVTTHPAYLEAIPGVVAEICVPLRVEGCVAGSLNVESFITLSPDVVREVELCAELLGVRLAELGSTARESAQQRLVRHAARFAEGADRHAIEHAVLAAALDVSDLDSAALVLDGPAGLAVVDAIGPLAPVLRHIDAADLAGLGRLVEQVASCYTAGDSTDAGFVGTEGLRAAGARTVVVVPLMAHGRRCGMLLVADMTTATFQTGDAELLELLASHAGTCLANADLLEMLRDRARRDPLTGLSNHSAFHELLDLLVQQQCGGTLLLADIDRFKAVNDQEGHPTGDELLRGVAHALQAVLRTEDDLFRIGGDEFAAILRQLEPAAGEAVAARLTDAASAVLRAHGAALSVGIAHLRPDELATELVERADRALYQAKREGCGVRLAEG
jgi:diguanylate cyclase (GGDEF)-like protein